ncbi:MAG: rhomboid family intramembrane serine protease [Candidatus Melainabacteria bacterium]|nr:rhomboid family intramembrane serine protease [Candidatus Melainabacteria bacterium]
MSSQATLWLYPLVLMAVFALIGYVRIGLSWTWGFCIQALLILSAALMGFVFNHAAGLFALAGWGLFLLTVIVPRTILSRLSHSLAMLNADEAQSYARVLRWFFWGAPGRFWTDMAYVISYYINGNTQAATALIQTWQNFPLPKSTREGLQGFLLTGRIILRDWHGIIAELSTIRASQQGKVAHNVLIAASRAYLELKMVNEALECLELSNLASARLSDEALYMVFLPFFSLTGSQAELDELLSSFSNKGQHMFPKFVSLYWRGRCFAVQGKLNEAKEALNKALTSAPKGISAWPDRIKYELQKLSQTPALMPGCIEEFGGGLHPGQTDLKDPALKGGVSVERDDWSSQIQSAATILQRAKLVSQITSPATPGIAVRLLMAAIVTAYAVSHVYTIVPGPETLELSLSCFRAGILESHLVYAGQYWRLVSYLFLHTHISHLVLNLIGLWWFGRLAENLYGTGRFLVIYFLSGILSGIAHVFLSPEMMAVGASGAIMGIFGATTSGIYRLKQVLPNNIRKMEVSAMISLAILQIVLDQIVPHVAVFAHLGGLGTGLLVGLVMPMPKFHDRLN